MTATPATAALDAAGVPYTIRSYVHDARSESFGLEAATALDVDPDRVFKTLVAVVDGELAVAVLPVTRRLDLGMLAAAADGKRAAMADRAVAERRTGYVLGGISPLGQRFRHRTFVDASAELWDAILVSGGRRGLELELARADLVSVTDAAVRRLSSASDG